MKKSRRLHEAVLGFERLFGEAPAGVWSAPGRVNLIGEHTDYNDGFVLPIAIEQRAWVAVRLRSDNVIRVGSAAVPEIVQHSTTRIGPETVSGWSAYPLGAAWGLLEVAGRQALAMRGFDAYFTSDVPLGAGLSSSAAIECSIALALSELWALRLRGEDLLRAAHLAENVVAGAPTGILDQAASLFARAGHALLIDCRSTAMELIPLDLQARGLNLLVTDTGVTHSHAHGGYASRRLDCLNAARCLGVPALRDASIATVLSQREEVDEATFRRARHVVTENERVLRVAELLRTDGPRAIGELLTESHRSMAHDFNITCPEVDLAVEAAIAAGALGARMTGGGFGGSTVSLVPTSHLSTVASAISKSFTDNGFVQPTSFGVLPSYGARREALTGSEGMRVAAGGDGTH